MIDNGKPAKAGNIFLSDKEKPVYDEAVRLAGLGIFLIPIHSIRSDGFCTCGRNGKNGKLLCDKPGKHPISSLLQTMVDDGMITEKNWQKCASRSRADIDYWFNEKPYLNIAVPCLDNNFLVADFEGPTHVYEGENAAFKGMNGAQLFEEMRRKFPGAFETVIVRSGSGGYHVYWLQPENEKIMTSKIVQPIVEVRSYGSYVVAPKSMHKSGQRYEYLPGHAFGEIPVKQIPPELVLFLKGLKAASSPGSELQVLDNDKADKFYYRGSYSIEEREKKIDAARYGRQHTAEDILKAEQWLDHYTTGKNMPKVHNRNDKAWLLSCQLRDEGIPYKLARTIILRFAKKVNQATRGDPEYHVYTDNRALIQLINAYVSEPRAKPEPQGPANAVSQPAG